MDNFCNSYDAGYAHARWINWSSLEFTEEFKFSLRTSSQGKWFESSTVHSLECVEPMLQDVWSWISGSETLLH